MIIAGTKYPEAQRILVAHLDNLLQTEALQNLKNVRCVRLNVYTQTHTHTHTHTHTQHQVGDFRTCKKKKVPASYVLHFLLSTQQHSITPTPPPDGKKQ